MQIAERVQRIAASQSLAMAARARAMKAAGIDVISMSLGEPDMDTPEHIRRAAQEAIDSGWTHYGPVAGITSLREAIASSQNANGLEENKNIQNTACADININNISNQKCGDMACCGQHGLSVRAQSAIVSELPSQLNHIPSDTASSSAISSPYKNTSDSSDSQKIQKNVIVWEAEDVIVSVGAKMAIFNAIQTVINPGDEVVIPIPSWVSYSEMVKIAGGQVVAVTTRYENRYCLTAEELRGALTEKTGMLILCSPNNPTGSVYSYEELKAIVEVLRDYPQVVVLSDEIYSALVYEENIQNTANADININKEEVTKNAHPESVEKLNVPECNQYQLLTSELAAPVPANTPGSTTPNDSSAGCLQKNVDCVNSQKIQKNRCISMAEFGEIADRLIIVNGVSKAYAMTGWRIGWLMSKNKAFIEACTRLQGQQVTCATMVAQKAAEAALTGSQECVAQMRQVFAERRELICRLAAEIPGWKFEKPQGAFYLFPDVSAIGGGDAVAEYLLEEAHVAVVSGSAFGCPECIRLSYAISTEEIIEAMKRIKSKLTTKS